MSTKPDDQLRHELYVILFSSGQRMLLSELAKLVKEQDHERIKNILSSLRIELDAQNAPVMLLQDGDEYKLAVRSKFMALVQKVVKQTELPKSMLETLAVIAYKTPVLQSDVIRIRTNKAYEHISKLEELGYISREPHGRTKLCRVTQKFYDYFEISPEELAKKIEKRQIKDVGESQTKITAIEPTVGGLHVYGQPTVETVTVQPYKEEKIDNSIQPDVTTEKQEPDDEGTLFESEQPEKKIATVSTFEIPEKKEVSDDEPKKVGTEKKGAKEKETKPLGLDNDHVPEKPKKKATKKRREADKEYEPPKVKGGFSEFTSEEKEKIKEEIEEITKSEKD